ncbi:hypothetical protein ABLN97_01990 [Mycobacterium tuberculosis]
MTTDGRTPAILTARVGGLRQSMVKTSFGDGDIHSLVIASDYRVPDPGKCGVLRRGNSFTDSLVSGAHHVLIASTHGSGRVLVAIGVRGREPIVG